MGQKIYVGNLSFKTDNQGLENHFSQYGQVTEARVVMDRESGRSRGFGFVTFSSDDEANSALAANGQNFEGRDLRVSEAQEQNRGGGQRRF